jgi:hypothetical protein
MLRYATEALNTIEVQIPVECNASDTTTNDSGWAEIKLVGFLHRIEENDARSAVTQACSAPGTQSRPIE